MRIVRACILALLLAGPAFLQAAEEPAVLLAGVWRGDKDLAEYLVSEKLDGVRAYWDGTSLRFRSGNPVHAPSWFVDALPKRALDGELWIGRGSFERLVGIVRRSTPDDAEWRQIRYMIFELPDAPGGFRERADAINVVVRQAQLPWLQAVEQFRLADAKALRKKLTEVIEGGGEGLMLHRVDAPYVTGRNDVLLKVKAWHDAEARVVAHVPGKGRFAGMLGALRVRMDDGREFAIGTGFSEAVRRQPPPIGALITYRYRELTARGMPRFASFWRVRDPL